MNNISEINFKLILEGELNPYNIIIYKNKTIDKYLEIDNFGSLSNSGCDQKS